MLDGGGWTFDVPRPRLRRTSARILLWFRSLTVGVALLAGLAHAAKQVEFLAPDAQVTHGQRLRIGDATASSSLSDQYAPGRICDGNRQTKWVAPTRPTATAPQWITAALAEGVQSVSAVAVFGERIDNDGIVDADVQVDAGNGFTTVASVRGATASAWLATFDPVRAAHVRLLVLRSGGPTDHTDVYELEVCGEPASPAELRAQLATTLARLEREVAATSHALDAGSPDSNDLPPPLLRAWQNVTTRIVAWTRGESDWEQWDRDRLARSLVEMEDLGLLMTRFRDRLSRRALGHSVRAERVDRPRPADETGGLNPTGPSIRLEPGRAVCANDTVALGLDTSSNRWSAAWGAGIEASLSNVGFMVEADGGPIAGPATAVEQRTFQDPLGAGQEFVQTWQQEGLRIERTIRVYATGGALTFGGSIRNERATDARLGRIDLVRLDEAGAWTVGSTWEAPAAVWIQGHSLLRSRPFAAAGALDPAPEHAYRSSGVLALVGRDPDTALIVGYVRADEAAPELAATFRLDHGGTALSATSRFHGRVLGSGERLELNRVYLAAERDGFRALEAYGDAVARFSARPVRTGPTALWCSWYAHRMGMTEEKVLANAAVAARHFQPLGLEIMQLDHGWQRGDITGDWVVNERFPHGLPWLAQQLRERHGLRLGVWIAPTDVAETSELYRQRPEWLLRGDDGRPRVNWRWYWKPNPNCYELDATHPGAYRATVETFRRLSSEGVSYYKIDFIASAGGEHFIQHDPKATRGWSTLRRAMEAIREVCDMSVRMQGSVEEARLRAALMALANCSISWSDELCYLPPSRIRLMQQAMPPGNPPMRPLDLFQRDIPSVWHVRATNAAGVWDVVGLFNFDKQPAVRAVRFADLGLDPQAEYAAFEFWEGQFLGARRGAVELTLPGESSRILSLRRVTGVPQLVGTDMHLLQGWHEVRQWAWDGENGVLSGCYERMPGIGGRAYLLVPAGYAPKFDFPLSPASARLTHVGGELWMQEIEFAERQVNWSIPFETPRPPEKKEPTGT